ncbi:MAG TPA: flagellar motor protein MotB, partial [Acidimicrobiales bacterium]|nr:flagellar motor protein MotB [Acidimicrobiales bacterium]
MPTHKKRARDEGHEEGPSAERWLLTYSDMITLLMVLFIVLFALGQTDIRKFDAFKDSFHFLTTPTQQSTQPPGGPGVLSQPSAIAVIEQNPFARLETVAANASGGMTQVGQNYSGHQRSGQQNGGQTS